eukprot:6457777-Amphidinium_carterae.2
MLVPAFGLQKWRQAKALLWKPVVQKEAPLVTNHFWSCVLVLGSGKELSKAEALCEQFSMDMSSLIHSAKKVAGKASVTMSEACLMQLLEDKDMPPLAKRRKLDKESHRPTCHHYSDYDIVSVEPYRRSYSVKSCLSGKLPSKVLVYWTCLMPV